MIKVDLVSGFLGAGKTTLIKKILKAYEEEKVVLIENEFGEIGIDGEIIEKEGFSVVEIAKGCICCMVKNNFLQQLEIIIKEYNPDRILIEPTGISVLSEIIEVIKKEQEKGKLILNSITTVIDAMHFEEHIEVFGEFFQDQIKNAGVLLLSKSQFVEEHTIERVVKSLRELNEEAKIIASPWDKLSYHEIKKLLDFNIIDLNNIFHGEFNFKTEEEFQALGIKTVIKFTEENLKEKLEKLKSNEYGKVLRAKGFLKGEKENLEFSYASGTYEILSYSGDESGKLCIIGQNLKEKELKKLFQFSIGGLVRWKQ